MEYSLSQFQRFVGRPPGDSQVSRPGGRGSCLGALRLFGTVHITLKPNPHVVIAGDVRVQWVKMAR